MDAIDNYLFFAGFLGLMTERTLHPMFLWARPSLIGQYTQFGRYVVAAAGFAISVLALGLPVAMFGLHAVIARLGDYYAASHVFGVAAWAIAGIHLLQLVASVVMSVWWHFHPTRFVRREHWLYGALIEDSRFMEGYLRSADSVLTRKG